MSEIVPINSSAIGRVGRDHSDTGRSQVEQSDAPARRGDDRVEVSDMARLLSKLKDAPPERTDLIARVRAEIDAGTYESPDKIDAAIEGAIDDLEIN